MPRMVLLALAFIVIFSANLIAENRPNFVIILCDDLGYGDLECYGHSHIKTPNLNQLAEEGIRLTSCYSSAPVCSPSRVGILTGRTPNRAGVYDWIPDNHEVHLKQDETTIATLLNTAGYQTVMVGKWHCNGKFNSMEQPQPGDHGFDHWYATQNNASPSHENPRNFVRNGQDVGPQEGFSCQLVADEAIQWMKKKRNEDEPFFLHVCFHEPHEPVASPKSMVAKYRDVAETDDQAQYFANVENMDKAVGRIVGTLDQLNLSDNTLVFFTSDNGPETLNRYRSANRSYGSPGPLRGMKLHIYEGGIRVAGILRWTGTIKAGQTSEVPVVGTDMLPTFCKLADVNLPTKKRLDGESIVPLLSGQSVKRTHPMFWHYYRSISEPRVALRDGDWKIVARWQGQPEAKQLIRTLGRNVNAKSVEMIKTAELDAFELYNLKADLAESNDLSNAEPEVFSQMKQKILSYFAEVQQESPRWPGLE